VTAAIDAERTKSPRRGMCAAVLTLEAIVVALSTPIMITLGDVSKGLALGTGLGLAAACVLVAGMLRKEWGYALGWALQVGAIALGLLTPTMYFLGRRIEQERAAAFAAYDRRSSGGESTT
jgi:hypothetical protein